MTESVYVCVVALPIFLAQSSEDKMLIERCKCIVHDARWVCSKHSHIVFKSSGKMPSSSAATNNPKKSISIMCGIADIFVHVEKFTYVCECGVVTCRMLNVAKTNTFPDIAFEWVWFRFDSLFVHLARASNMKLCIPIPSPIRRYATWQRIKI